MRRDRPPLGGAGQIVKAFVVLRSGLGGYEPMVKDLHDIVKAVAQYQVPAGSGVPQGVAADGEWEAAQVSVACEDRERTYCKSLFPEGVFGHLRVIGSDEVVANSLHNCLTVFLSVD